jgi:hypothetical protein
VLERNHQVHLMGSIYRQASHVIEWSGLQRDDSDLGMDFLKEWDDSGHTPEVWDSQNSFAEKDAISYICTRNYWRRMWIVQETQLASKLSLQCGTRSVPAKALLSSYRYRTNGYREAKISSTLVVADTPADFLLQQGEKCLKGSPQSNFGPWLTWAVAQESLCTEPRDIVYALLGVAADCRSGMIELDYTKPIEKVFADVIRLLSVDERSDVANHLAIAIGLTNTWRHPGAPVQWLNPELIKSAYNQYDDHDNMVWDSVWDGTIFGDKSYENYEWAATIDFDVNDTTEFEISDHLSFLDTNTLRHGTTFEEFDPKLFPNHE